MGDVWCEEIVEAGAAATILFDSSRERFARIASASLKDMWLLLLMRRASSSLLRMISSSFSEDPVARRGGPNL